MRSFTVKTLTAFAFLAISVKAQVPAFKGQLLLEPGLSSAKCLTAASNINAASVTIQPCTGSASQKWTFGGGVVKVFGDKCLAVPEGSAADGTKLQISTCLTDNPNQKWGYTRDNRMTWTNKGKCIDLTGGNLADGTSVQIWSCSGGNANQVWNTGYMVNDLPTTSQDGQYGINNCGTGSSQSSNCQTAWINSASDFCLWAPPTSGTIGDTEAIAIAYCTKSGRGTRTIPNGALTGVHFVKTPEYVQVTGVGDLTKLNVPQGDEGGELDNKGLMVGAIQLVVLSTATASAQVSNIMNGPASSQTRNSVSVLASELVPQAFATISTISWVAIGIFRPITTPNNSRIAMANLLSLWLSTERAHGTKGSAPHIPPTPLPLHPAAKHSLPSVFLQPFDAAIAWSSAALFPLSRVLLLHLSCRKLWVPPWS